MLVERLMGLADDGSAPGDGYNLKIPVHGFFAACGEVIAGRLTAAQVKAIVWQAGAPAMRTNPNDQAEFNALAALAPGTQAGNALYLESIHGVFMLAEMRIAGYDTPAAIRAKLGI
jgi:hypothetical protein